MKEWEKRENGILMRRKVYELYIKEYYKVGAEV